jgi:hypothetical protein
MPLTVKSPEQLRADRVAREAREKENAQDRLLSQRGQVSALCMIVGVLLLLTGVWFLLFSPGVAVDTVNLQKLYLGQTCAFVGAILFASGVLLKYLR